jgi:hypothetical protein
LASYRWAENEKTGAALERDAGKGDNNGEADTPAYAARFESDRCEWKWAIGAA